MMSTAWNPLLFAAMTACLLSGVVACAADAPAANRHLTLWYEKPAKPNSGMNEALPLGNGRLGGLVFGAPAAERIALNEDSLWTGDANPTGDYDKGTFGAYQALGDLLIAQPGHENATAYRRDLNLADATASVQYQVAGVTYRREYFASHPAGALVVRLTADKPGACTGTVALNDSHTTATTAEGNRLTFAGALSNGLKYEAQLAALAEGGTLRAAEGKLEFQGCNSLTLLLVAGTDYALDFTKGYRGDPPHARLTAQLQAAAAKTYDALRAEHIRDYQALFNRVMLDVGPSPAERLALPIDQRKVQAGAGGDPELEALLFQYGRYLLIACSRPGGLPANLQGLWNVSNNPPWRSDYHANINVQMNYWPAEATNLPECHEPLFSLIQSQLEPWRQATAAAKEYQLAAGGAVRGWAIRTSHNIFGGLGWQWDKTANAWYCQHLWDHYAFSGDARYLRTIAYPILKETCEFWEDHLQALPDGRLVVPQGWSPEHGPHEDGVSYNQQIVWDLFSNYVEASAALGVDAEYRAKIAGLRDKLVGPAIGKWGQLQEWMTDRDDPKDNHRHTSHLYAVYPGRQISLAKTPELAEAARKSLEARGEGGDVREWSFAWRCALRARLHDGEVAHRMVLQFLKDRNSCLNLFGQHPPMQIDGNFGITAGMAEMLVQSREGEINLLPALPPAWPSGAVTGLRARGGFTVALAWQAGKLTAATLRSTTGTAAKVRYGTKTVDVTLTPGEAKAIALP